MDVFGKSLVAAEKRGEGVTGQDSDLAPIRGARVLLVEDNKINQEVAYEILEGAGLNIVIANNGKECMDMLKRERGDFDAILMDLQMPVMDGFEATEKIRNSKEFREIPIIAMTAHAMESDRIKCLEAGMNDHTSKPIDPVQLNRTLLRWIARGRPEEVAEGGSPVSPQPASSPAAPDELPAKLLGFDLERGLRTMSGNRQLYRRLLGQFRSDYRNMAEQIKNAYYAGDYDRAHHLAHTIKGVSGNVAALRVHETASELDDCLKKRNHSQFPKYMSAFARALEESLNSLAGFQESPVSMGTPPPFQVKKIDAEAVAPVLEKLHRMLRESRMDADQEAEKLQSVLRATRYEGLAYDLEDKIQSYDFEAALKLVEKLANALDIPISQAP